MIRSLSFKADPPLAFHTYNYHLKKAIKEGYNNSPRNPEKKSEIIRQLVNGLTELFEIPTNYHLTFLRENNLIEETLSSMDRDDKIMIIRDIDPQTGQKFRLETSKKSPSKSFMHLDISLSSPTDALAYENFQSFSFETKYGFGMEQDLLVWIIREDMLDIVKEKVPGTLMEFDADSSKSKKCIIQDELQILSIYILGKIIQDFLNRGLKIIRNEIKYKSIILYKSISDNPNFDPLIEDPNKQSPNIICADTDIPGEKIIDFMSRNRIEIDVLPGTDDKPIIRIANYPVHSKEQVEFLVDLIEKL